MGIEEICMTTNAIKLYDMADDLKESGVDRFNISLDTLDADKFRDITRGGDLSKVLKSIDKLKQMDMKPIKINTVVMRHFNYDEIEDFVKFAEDGVIVRFIELMPIGEAIGKSDDYVSNEEIIKKIGNLQKLTPIQKNRRLQNITPIRMVRLWDLSIRFLTNSAQNVTELGWIARAIC